MKSNREIRKSAKILYEKNGVFIFSTLFVTITLMGLVRGLSQNIWLAILLFATWPFEHAIVLTVVRTMKGKGKNVSLKEYLFAGFKDYPKWMKIYGGRMIFVLLTQALIVFIFAIFALAMNGDIKVYLNIIEGMITGNAGSFFKVVEGTGEIVFVDGHTYLSVLALFTTQVVGFVASFVTLLIPYFAVDQELDFFDSLRNARKVMKGKIFRLVFLRLGYILWIILAIAGTQFVMMFLDNLYRSFAGLGYGLPGGVYDFIYIVISSVVSGAISAYAYLGKEYLAIGLFYQELTGKTKKSLF